jgi:hypothetical protein
MADLDQLIAEAGQADLSTRINYRDGIAAYGEMAIPVMSAWITDPELGAFAVRVLQRIAQDASLRARVIRVLANADRQSLSPGVARDVDAALAALRPTGPRPTSRSGPNTSRTKHYVPPVLAPDATVEERFHQAMLDIYWLAGEASGY